MQKHSILKRKSLSVLLRTLIQDRLVHFEKILRMHNPFINPLKPTRSMGATLGVEKASPACASL